MSQSSSHPSSSSSPSHQGWALLALAAAVLLWGTSYAAAKTALGSFSPSVLIALRMVMASLVLLPFWRRLPKPNYRPGDWKWLLGLGLLQPCLYFMLEVKALQFTSSGQAGTVAALAPLFVALLAWIWLKERMGLNGILGLLLSLTGVVLLSLGASHQQSAPDPLLGNSLQLLAMLCVALYMVILKRLSSRYDTWWLTGSQNLLGVLFFVPGLITAPEGTLSAAPAEAWYSVIYLGGLVSLGGFGLYNMAMRWLPASQAAMSINLVPLVALLMGWIWLGEALTPLQLVAALAIFGGVLLGQWTKPVARVRQPLAAIGAD